MHEKHKIINDPNLEELLNKHSELVSKCRMRTIIHQITTKETINYFHIPAVSNVI